MMVMANTTVGLSGVPPQDKVDDVISTAIMILYGVIAVVGTCGNSLTIVSILLNKKLKSIPNVYIGNLAIADLIVCSIIAPFSAYIIATDVSAVPTGVCTFIGALNIGLLAQTMFSLAAIAINRYTLLVKGGDLYTRLYTRRNVVLSVMILWIMPAMLILPALLGFGSFGYNSLMGTCMFMSHDVMTYIFVESMLHGICVGPCVCLTLYCYIRIIIHFRRTQHRLQMSAKKSLTANHSQSKTSSSGVEYVAQDNSKVEDYELSSSGPSNNNSSSANHAHAAKRNRAARRVVTNLCTVFVVFLCCWLPIVTIFTIDFYNRFPAAVYHIFFTFAISNSCLNVFIYAGMNRVFRRTYARLLCCQFKKVNSQL